MRRYSSLPCTISLTFDAGIYLISVFGLRELKALLFMVNHAKHTVLDDDYFLNQHFELVDSRQVLRPVPIKPDLSEKSEVVLNLASLGWIKVIRVHTPQFALFYLFFQQISFLKQKIDLPHELAGFIPSVFISSSLAWGKELHNEVGVETLQLLVALAVGHYLCFDAGHQLIDFSLGEVAVALRERLAGLG
jgi:hypothetical protein